MSICFKIKRIYFEITRERTKRTENTHKRPIYKGERDEDFKSEPSKEGYEKPDFDFEKCSRVKS